MLFSSSVNLKKGSSLESPSNETLLSSRRTATDNNSIRNLNTKDTSQRNTKISIYHNGPEEETANSTSLLEGKDEGETEEEEEESRLRAPLVPSFPVKPEAADAELL